MGRFYPPSQHHFTPYLRRTTLEMQIEEALLWPISLTPSYPALGNAELCICPIFRSNKTYRPCRSWCPQGEKGMFSPVFSLSTWETTISIKFRHKLVSRVFVNMAKFNQIGCEEFTTAQSEQLDTCHTVSTHWLPHTWATTIPSSKNYSFLHRKSSWVSHADNGVGEGAQGSITLSRLWKVSVKIKGGRRPLWELCLYSCSKENQSSYCLQGKFALLFQS